MDDAQLRQILADIDLKQEQLRHLRTIDKEAKNDQILADIALKQEQLRAMKAFENWRFVLQVLTVGAAIGGAIGVWVGFMLRHA